MKKRIIALLITLSTLLSLFPATTFANSGVKVAIDGKTIEFDVEPQIINGRTMVPMRKIFEELGANVEWDGETKTITSTKNNSIIILQIGIKYISTNGTTSELDVAPCIINNRTLVPVRAISEAFGCDVEWDGSTKTVSITRPKVNSVAYNQLKNTIMFNGKKERDGVYSLSYTDVKFENDYMAALLLQSTDDYIFLSYTYIQENTELVPLLTIALSENLAPVLAFTLKNKEIEYELSGYFPDPTKTFTVLENNIPDSLQESAYNFINLALYDMDNMLKTQINMSLSNFGVYYEK